MNYDTIRFPLPEGNWTILNIDGKIVTLKNKLKRRNFWSKWY